MKVVLIEIPFKEDQLVKTSTGGYSISFTLPEECKRVVSFKLSLGDRWELVYEA